MSSVALRNQGANKAFFLGRKKQHRKWLLRALLEKKEKQGVALRVVAKEISIVWMFSVCLGFFFTVKISKAMQLGRMLLGRLGSELHNEGLDQGSPADTKSPPKTT